MSKVANLMFSVYVNHTANCDILPYDNFSPEKSQITCSNCLSSIKDFKKRQRMTYCFQARHSRLHLGHIIFARPETYYHDFVVVNLFLCSTQSNSTSCGILVPKLTHKSRNWRAFFRRTSSPCWSMLYESC